MECVRAHYTSRHGTSICNILLVDPRELFAANALDELKVQVVGLEEVGRWCSKRMPGL